GIQCSTGEERRDRLFQRAGGVEEPLQGISDFIVVHRGFEPTEGRIPLRAHVSILLLSPPTSAADRRLSRPPVNQIDERDPRTCGCATSAYATAAPGLGRSARQQARTAPGRAGLARSS